jgi:uncharacterized protein
MNPVVHFEMPYNDRARMARFYEAAFDWRTQQLGPDMGNYVLATTATQDATPGAPAGAINGGFFERKADWPAQVPSIVIGTPDIHASLARVQAAGGRLMGEPMEIPGVGWYASFMDTEDNRVSLLQPLMPADSGA